MNFVLFEYERPQRKAPVVNILLRLCMWLNPWTYKEGVDATPL